MHIVLMPSGSKRGWGKVIIGAILVALAYYYGGPAAGAEMSWQVTMVMSFGVNLMLAGVTELTTKAPKHNKDEEKGLFNGPENTLVQGTPVPVAYGKLLVGGKPISVNFKPSGGIGSTVASGGGLSGLVLAQMWNNALADWINEIDSIDTSIWDDGVPPSF